MPLTPDKISKLPASFVDYLRTVAKAISDAKPTPSMAYALRDNVAFELWPDDAIEAVGRITANLLRAGMSRPPAAPGGAPLELAAGATSTERTETRDEKTVSTRSTRERGGAKKNGDSIEKKEGSITPDDVIPPAGG